MNSVFIGYQERYLAKAVLSDHLTLKKKLGI